MTISDYRVEASTSLAKIAKYVKNMRYSNCSKKESRLFLKAFERDFLDGICVIVSATHVHRKESLALESIKITHYDAGRVCLESIVNATRRLWRKMKSNKDVLINEEISQGEFDSLTNTWNQSVGLLSKTRHHINKDKISACGTFDVCIETMERNRERMEEVLSQSRFRRVVKGFRECVFSLVKTHWMLLVLPLLVAILLIMYKGRISIEKPGELISQQEKNSTVGR